jgi:hypothetical protein
MITLPHHVEFLSHAWRDEARRFLAGEAGGAPGRPRPAERSRAAPSA